MKNTLSNKWQNAMLTLGMAMSLFSCSPEEIFPTQEIDASKLQKFTLSPTATNFSTAGESSRTAAGLKICGEATTVALIAGQITEIGKVSVYNDEENLYVTLSIERNYTQDWYIQKSHLYIGEHSTTLALKNPSPGQFPYQFDAVAATGSLLQEHTFTIPAWVTTAEGRVNLIESWGSFDIALHADLVQVSVDGWGKTSIIKEEGAWGAGAKFSELNNIRSNNWAMYFGYQWQACDPCDPTFVLKSRMFDGNGGKGKGADVETYNIDFSLNGETITVGEAEIRYTALKSDNTREVIVNFTVDKEGFTLEEASAYLSGSSIGSIDRNLFQAKLIRQVTKGKWQIIFEGITGAQYVALYAKVGGVCK